MKRSNTLGLAWIVLALTAGHSAARETEALGTSSQPIKVAPNKSSKPPARDVCKQGYVWREARPSDHVCVDPKTRDEVAQQNRNASRLWVNGDYGPRTCRSGYVWREAFEGDLVCVRPIVRERTRADNQEAMQRRARG